MVINQKFFISGFKSLWHKAPNMDNPGGPSVPWRHFTTVPTHRLPLTDAQVKGKADAVMSYMHEFYFESAAMILTLITVGRCRRRAPKENHRCVKEPDESGPKTAVVVRNGEEVTVGIEGVQKGDVFVVRPGEHRWMALY